MNICGFVWLLDSRARARERIQDRMWPMAGRSRLDNILILRLPLLSTRHAVTFPAAEHHRPLAGTKLYCLVTEAHRCKQLAQGCYAAFALSRIWTHDLLMASPINALPVAPPRHPRCDTMMLFLDCRWGRCHGNVHCVHLYDSRPQQVPACVRT